jgi:iron complex transport system substrate-binding protein
MGRAPARLARAGVALGALGLAAVTFITSGGCRVEPAARRSHRPGNSAAAAAAVPARLVTLAPSLTETAYALGLGDRVVGVSDYTAWPPEAATKPRLGGLFNPDLERILGLKPDLALLLPSQRDLAAKLGRLGIATLVVPSESLADVERAFVAVGDRCGRREAGRAAAARFRAALAPRPVAHVVVGRGAGSRPLRVFLAAGREPGRMGNILAAGPGTFLDELLTRLGGRNVFADAPARYAQVGLEEIVARAPDAVLELQGDPLPETERRRLLADWRSLPGLSAAAAGHVTILAGDYVLIPGPRLPHLYDEMAAALARAAADLAQSSGRRAARPDGRPDA